MDDTYNRLLTVVAVSMKAIEADYFNFRVADKENPIERERVYCAELYHQMRQRFDGIGYYLNNEPNKKGHPIIEKLCGPVDPDFVVHRMGSMGPTDNLAVIEVKRSRGDLSGGVTKDMNTINCMGTIENGYYGGIIVVFGHLAERRRASLLRRIVELRSRDLRRLTVFLQLEAEANPEIIEINKR
jgi:hypothetical protein